MFRNNSQKLYLSFYPLYIILKMFAIFVQSFDSSYCLEIRIFDKLYAASVIILIAGLFLWNIFINVQSFLNSSELLDSALKTSLILGGVSLLLTVVYLQKRSENLKMIFTILNQIDDKVGLFKLTVLRSLGIYQTSHKFNFR
ncbi:hypothetical protein ACKWTF_013437 [Chironomus riparius]